MTNILTRLQEIGRSQCLPYLLTLPKLAPHSEQLSFLLVGSVATGLCVEGSDIDIAILCNAETYQAISEGESWDAGRPSEAFVGGVQLHYYGAPFDSVEAQLRGLDDLYVYVYGTAIILRDPGGTYTRRFAWLKDQAAETRKQRLEGKFDMLVRRSRALQTSLREGDVLTTARVCVELITRCLKVCALLDDVPFDPRKRLFTTALKGKLGTHLENRLRELVSTLGSLGNLKEPADFADFAFAPKLEEAIGILSAEAGKRGFRVGLDSPDRRQMRE